MKGGGGARPGAGRKPKPKPEAVKSTTDKPDQKPESDAKKRGSAHTAPQGNKDMLKFLQEVALGLTEASNTQVRAAIAAVQYTHTKKGDGGKKDELEEKAKKAAGGKFAVKAPPKLVVNNK